MTRSRYEIGSLHAAAGESELIISRLMKLLNCTIKISYIPIIFIISLRSANLFSLRHWRVFRLIRENLVHICMCHYFFLAPLIKNWYRHIDVFLSEGIRRQKLIFQMNLWKTNLLKTSHIAERDNIMSLIWELVALKNLLRTGLSTNCTNMLQYVI